MAAREGVARRGLVTGITLFFLPEEKDYLASTANREKR